MNSISKAITVIFFAFQYLSINAATNFTGGHYWVSFTDKNNSPYSVSQPLQFLSQRSIDRRTAQGIRINEADLPPNPSYVNALASIDQLQVLYTSRWFNGVLVFSETGGELQEVLDFPFVSGVELVKPIAIKLSQNEDVNYNHHGKFATISGDKSIVLPFHDPRVENIDLGLMAATIDQVNARGLIEDGYLGQGKAIALLDAGFTNVNQVEAFGHLFSQGKIVGTRDFVDPNQAIFSSHGHGTVVLSVMAAIMEGELFGTATGANYWLVRTEDAQTEYRIEEYNWLAGAELADSAGVDIINSSLGYSLFDLEAHNYTYGQMNGNTTIVARAANIAQEKGMIVIASAGNSGQSGWMHIVSPSDAFGAMSIGAVNAQGERVQFSSIGPSSDGRVKPDVMAHGLGVPVVTSSGEVANASGTSLSSPVIAGLCAALWQKFSGANSVQITDAIKASSSMFSDPDFFYGYGIPDFEQASAILSSIVEPHFISGLEVYPNPFSSSVSVVFQSSKPTNACIEIYDVSGRLMKSKSDLAVSGGTNRLALDNLQNLGRGLFILRISMESGELFQTSKLIKIN